MTRKYGTKFTTWDINLIRFGFAAVVMSLGVAVIRLKLRLCSRERNGSSEESTLFEPSTTSITSGTSRPQDKSSNTDVGDSKSRKSELYMPSLRYRDWLYVSCGAILVTFFTPAMNVYALFPLNFCQARTFRYLLLWSSSASCQAS